MGGLDVIASAAKQSISPCEGRMDCFASLAMTAGALDCFASLAMTARAMDCFAALAMTPGLWNRGACHRARIRATRWIAMTDARREHSTCSPHSSRALLNANHHTRLA